LKAVEEALKSFKEYALFKFARPRGAADGPPSRDYSDYTEFSCHKSMYGKQPNQAKIPVAQMKAMCIAIIN
jgi:hypothetical protein